MPLKNKADFEEVFGQALDELNVKLGARLDKIDENLAIVNNDLMHIKDHLIQELLEENNLLRNKVDKLELDVQQNLQKQRENNIEISGIPSEVADDQLEATVINILGSIQCNLVPDNIQACHRLPSRNNLGKKTIVKFVNRKKSDLALRNRRMIKDVEKSFNEKFTGNKQLYIVLMN